MAKIVKRNMLIYIKMMYIVQRYFFTFIKMVKKD